MKKASNFVLYQCIGRNYDYEIRKIVRIRLDWLFILKCIDWAVP